MYYPVAISAFEEKKAQYRIQMVDGVSIQKGIQLHAHTHSDYERRRERERERGTGNRHKVLSVQVCMQMWKTTNLNNINILFYLWIIYGGSILWRCMPIHNYHVNVRVLLNGRSFLASDAKGVHKNNNVNFLSVIYIYSLINSCSFFVRSLDIANCADKVLSLKTFCSIFSLHILFRWFRHIKWKLTKCSVIMLACCCFLLTVAL